ncbi:MAG: hypothetical protein RMX96_02345 [Nostoc sp. ChiSLP02]|nr:hypothetical protein [Nostoc sp. DedSLP05]MDZ8098699.1 hypothetical protein [Nostoc sp. DedSLP01]MDZ8183688.1 hypothetical protein [Nostoc sp. ChiSLP02]
MPTAWLLYETLRVACFPVGVRLERVRERRVGRRQEVEEEFLYLILQLCTSFSCNLL